MKKFNLKDFEYNKKISQRFSKMKNKIQRKSN